MILLLLALACLRSEPHQHGLAVLHPDPVCLGHITRVQIPSMGGRDTLQLLLLVAHTASRFTSLGTAPASSRGGFSFGGTASVPTTLLGSASTTAFGAATLLQ